MIGLALLLGIAGAVAFGAAAGVLFFVGFAFGAIVLDCSQARLENLRRSVGP